MKNERRVGKVVHGLSNQIKRKMDNLTIQMDIPMSQGRVLHYLTIQEGRAIFQKDLEEEFNLRRPSATAILQALEDHAYITREEVDYDKRLKKIIVSEKGKQEVPKIRAYFDLVETCLTSNISKEDMQTFYKVMDKMLHNLSQESLVSTKEAGGIK